MMQLNLSNLSTTIKGNKNPILRFLGIMFMFHFVSLLFGIGVWLIAFGIYTITKRIVLYWPPARAKFVSLLGFAIPGTAQPANANENWWPVILSRIIIMLVYVALGGTCIWVGGKILIEQGFLGQNFIYLFFFKP